jgi:hypothetical protein
MLLILVSGMRCCEVFPITFACLTGERGASQRAAVACSMCKEIEGGDESGIILWG